MMFLKNILIAILALLVMGSCQERKNYQDEHSQQQEFPLRTVKTLDNDSNRPTEQASDTLAEQVVTDSTSLNKDDDQKPVAHNAHDAAASKHSAKETIKANSDHKHHSNAKETNVERKTADEVEVEDHDVPVDNVIAHIGDDERDAAEDYYKDHWQKMPQEIVQQRPVAPRGKFHKFNPQEL